MHTPFHYIYHHHHHRHRNKCFEHFNLCNWIVHGLGVFNCLGLGYGIWWIVIRADFVIHWCARLNSKSIKVVKRDGFNWKNAIMSFNLDSVILLENLKIDSFWPFPFNPKVMTTDLSILLFKIHNSKLNAFLIIKSCFYDLDIFRFLLEFIKYSNWRLLGLNFERHFFFVSCLLRCCPHFEALVSKIQYFRLSC